MKVNTETLQGRQLDGLLRSENKRAQLRLTIEIRKDSGPVYHQTFRVKTWAGRDDHQMLTFDLNDGDWENGVRPTKVIHIDTTDGLIRDARGMTDAALLYAAKAAARWAFTGEGPAPSNGTITFGTASICGACGLELTHPASLELGVGPECASRLGLEHYYRSETLTARRRRGVTVTRDEAAEQALPIVTKSTAAVA